MALVSYVPHVLIVSNKLGVKSIPDLVALSKTRPINLATSGVGSASHMTLERFKQATGAQIAHVPYKSGGSLLPDVISGNVDGAMTELSTAVELHKGGQAHIVGVAGASRSKSAPDIPTFDEQGVKGFLARSFIGIVAPAKVPAEALAKLQAAIAGGVGAGTEAAAKLIATGSEIATPEQMTPRRLRRLHQTRLGGHAGRSEACGTWQVARRSGALRSDPSREEILHPRGLYVARDEGGADAAHQDEGEPAVPHLLVLAHDGRGGRRRQGRARREYRRCASAGRRRRVARSTRAASRRPGPAGSEAEGQADADGDGLAVQQPVGEAGPGLQRVAEGVAEVEQHAVAGLGLVAGDDGGLARHADGHGVRQGAAPPGPPRLANSAPARRRTRHRRAGHTWQPRRSPRGISRGGSVASTSMSASTRLG